MFFFQGHFISWYSLYQFKIELKLVAYFMKLISRITMSIVYCTIYSIHTNIFHNATEIFFISNIKHTFPWLIIRHNMTSIKSNVSMQRNGGMPN